MSPLLSEAERREKAYQVMVEPCEGRGAAAVSGPRRRLRIAILLGTAEAERIGQLGQQSRLRTCVHRDPSRDPTRTDIFVRKVRFKQVGKIGPEFIVA